MTVLDGGSLRLPSRDVFYFGNLAGETGDAASTAFAVTNVDVASTRAFRTDRAHIASAIDFNRDGRVNATDLAIARAGYGRSLPLLSAPGEAQVAAVPERTRRGHSRENRSSYLLTSPS